MNVAGVISMYLLAWTLLCCRLRGERGGEKGKREGKKKRKKSDN